MDVYFARVEDMPRKKEHKITGTSVIHAFSKGGLRTSVFKEKRKKWRRVDKRSKRLHSFEALASVS